MADEEQLPKKRKGKGKLIILMALIMMLGGGGFFAFTMKSKKGKHELPKIELSDKETELDEFLTNTSNPTVYVRAKIDVRLRKDFTEDTLKANMGDLRDAVVQTFNATNPSDITDATKRDDLKKRLASAMNDALKEADTPAKKFSPPKDTADWNSLTGPIIKVRFSALATQ
jgi:flagellar FliL protein